MVTNIIDLYFSSYYQNEDYYTLVVQSGDFRSRHVNANLWHYNSKESIKVPYSALGKIVAISYEYTDSSGVLVNTNAFECAIESSDDWNLISFTIPNICLMNAGDVSAQIKVYEDEYTLLNTCVFKIQVLESIDVGSYVDNQFPIIGFLKQATESMFGGIKASAKDENDTVEAKIDTTSGKLYVAASGYTLSQATDSALGGIKATERGEGDTVEAKIDTASGKLYVAASGYTLPQATSLALGGIKASTKGTEDTIEAKIDAITGRLYVAPNLYNLPQATSSALGGIKAVTKDENDTIEAKIDVISGKLYVAPNIYTLLQATESTLGGIKASTKGVGDTTEVKIDITTGKLYVAPSSYTLSQATSSTLGGIKATTKGEGDIVEAKIDTASGKLYVAASGYTLPQATSLALGGIKADVKTSIDTIPVKIDAETGILYVEPTSLEGLTANDIQTDTENVTVQDALDSKATVQWYTVSLPAIGWSESAPYTQTVSVSGLLETDIPIIDVILSSTLETRITQREAYSYISLIESGNDELTATCDETKPTVDLTIQLEVIK